MAIIDVNELRWHEKAACRGLGHSLFYGAEHERGPAKEDREARAKQICERCPVRRVCLDDAIERGDKYGIQGGLTEDERVSERRRRQRRANAA